SKPQPQPSLHGASNGSGPREIGPGGGLSPGGSVGGCAASSTISATVSSTSSTHSACGFKSRTAASNLSSASSCATNRPTSTFVGGVSRAYMYSANDTGSVPLL